MSGRYQVGLNKNGGKTPQASIILETTNVSPHSVHVFVVKIKIILCSYTVFSDRPNKSINEYSFFLKVFLCIIHKINDRTLPV